jgi:hypothetical protein
MEGRGVYYVAVYSTEHNHFIIYNSLDQRWSGKLPMAVLWQAKTVKRDGVPLAMRIKVIAS